MFLRTALTALFAMASLPAAAECSGVSYIDTLDDRQRAALDTAIADVPFGNGLFWEARKDDQLITVIGTIHIYDERLDPIRENLRDTITNADLILLEATPDDEAALQKQIAADPGMLFITDGPTLPEMLDEETWDLITEAASARMIPAVMASKMQPWYLSLTLSIPPCAVLDMASGDRGLDHMIMDDAAAAGVPMQALESFMTLFNAFKSDPMEEQIDMLRVSLMAPEQQSQMFVTMLDRYFAEDVAALWEVSRIAVQEAPGMDPETAKDLFAETEQVLLIDRNRNWMPVIFDATKTHDNIVVAVGAAHLIGTDGVLNLLQENGWTVTPR